jgi:hypothetical protein
MAKPSVPRARGRKPARPRQARDERLLLDLVGVRAACLTTVFCLQHRGPDNEIAINLRRAAVAPLDRALAELGWRS